MGTGEETLEKRTNAVLRRLDARDEGGTEAKVVYGSRQPGDRSHGERGRRRHGMFMETIAETVRET